MHFPLPPDAPPQISRREAIGLALITVALAPFALRDSRAADDLPPAPCMSVELHLLL